METQETQLQARARKVLENFLRGWTDPKYIKMYENSQTTWKNKHTVSDLKKVLHKRIKGYTVVSFDFPQDTPAICSAIVRVKINSTVKELRIILLCEIAPYNPDTAGTWGVNPISALKGLYIK